MKPFEERMRWKMERELTRVNELIAGLRFADQEDSLEVGDLEAWFAERSEMLGELLERAAALEEALFRLARGVFGQCIVCEKGIGHDEIEASPEVALCRECQALLDEARPPGPAARPPWGASAAPYRRRSGARGSGESGRN